MKQLYAIRDNKANEIVSAIMVLPHIAVAIRTFGDVINNTPTIKEHVRDYDLWYLGNFDEQTGQINSEPTCELTGADWHTNNNGTDNA